MKRLMFALVFIFAACEPVDEGWLVGPSGLELRPGDVPKGVEADASLGDDGLDHLLLETTQWWNEQIGFGVFYVGSVAPTVTVEVGQIAVGEMPDDMLAIDTDAGLARVRSAPATGDVTTCRVTLNADLAYDEPTMRQALRHELGHCLGLADDCGPPACVDLRSVMASPLDPLGELTDADRDRLHQALR